MKDVWETHKKNIQEGNPLDLLKAIRNDDVDKLQEISSQPKFNFNQRIQSNIYEMYNSYL